MAIMDHYHAHLYYNEDNLGEATALAEEVAKTFEVKVGRLHQKPVGPHPTWSCQLSCDTDVFKELIPWLMVNRGSVDVFVHGVSGDDLRDHTEYVMWLGNSYPLKLDMFRRSSTPS